MSINSAFSSRHKDVLVVVDAIREIDKAYGLAAKEFLDDFPKHNLVEIRTMRGSQAIGLVIKPEERGDLFAPFSSTKPGDAWWWKETKNGGCWVPYRNHKKDAELVKRLEAIKSKLPELPGMPREYFAGFDDIRGGAFSYRHSYFVAGRGRTQTAWVGWSVAAERLGDRVNGRLWKERKISEYYAAHESEFPKDKAS